MDKGWEKTVDRDSVNDQRLNYGTDLRKHSSGPKMRFMSIYRILIRRI